MASSSLSLRQRAAYCWQGVRRDKAYLQDRYPHYRPRTNVLELALNPSLRASFLARWACGGGPWGILARARLLSSFGCDFSAGAEITGALHLPHPTGVVVGEGVVLGDVTLYQHVTLGKGSDGGYPILSDSVTVYPAAMVTGLVTIGSGAVIGAQTFVSKDVPENAKIHSRTA